MARVEELTAQTAAVTLATDVMYVGRAGDVDPDRQMPVSELHALVGGVVTVNADGTAVRFPNGVQVCWHREESARSCSTNPTGSYWRTANATLTFPLAFSAPPYVVGTANEAAADAIGVIARQVTTTTALLVGWGVNNTQTVTIGYIAVGRWA